MTVRDQGHRDDVVIRQVPEHREALDSPVARHAVVAADIPHVHDERRQAHIVRRVREMGEHRVRRRRDREGMLYLHDKSL
jgi:hypothetical protein